MVQRAPLRPTLAHTQSDTHSLTDTPQSHVHTCTHSWMTHNHTHTQCTCMHTLTDTPQAQAHTCTHTHTRTHTPYTDNVLQKVQGLAVIFGVWSSLGVHRTRPVHSCTSASTLTPAPGPLRKPPPAPDPGSLQASLSPAVGAERHSPGSLLQGQGPVRVLLNPLEAPRHLDP